MTRRTAPNEGAMAVMKKPVIWTVTLTLALAAPLAAQQPGAEGEDDAPRWMVTAYAGGLGIDDGELDGVGMTSEASAVFGARLGYAFARNWAIEASYGYAGLDGTSEGFGAVDGRLHLYHVDLDFLAPDSARAQVVLSAGIGGVRYAYDEFERRGVLLQGQSWAHELVMTLGGGLLVHVSERFGLRAEARDVIQFCSAEAEPIDETHDFSHCPLGDATLHNPELSGGILLRF